MLLNDSLQDRATGFEDLLANGLDQPAPLEPSGWQSLYGREHAEAAHYYQIFDCARSDPIGTASHKLVLRGHHFVADARLGLALSAFYERVAAPPHPDGAATTAAGATPHLYTHRGDAVTGPGIRWPHREGSRGDSRDVSRLWLTAPSRPMRCRFSNTESLGQECPLSLTPAGLAVGFGPKELSPTLARRSQLTIHPADLQEDPCGSPAPQRHPEARRHGYSVVTFCIRLPRTNVKDPQHPQGMRRFWKSLGCTCVPGKVPASLPVESCPTQPLQDIFPYLCTEVSGWIVCPQVILEWSVTTEPSNDKKIS